MHLGRGMLLQPGIYKVHLYFIPCNICTLCEQLREFVKMRDHCQEGHHHQLWWVDDGTCSAKTDIAWHVNFHVEQITLNEKDVGITRPFVAFCIIVIPILITHHRGEGAYFEIKKNITW